MGFPLSPSVFFFFFVCVPVRLSVKLGTDTPKCWRQPLRLFVTMDFCPSPLPPNINPYKSLSLSQS